MCRLKRSSIIIIRKEIATLMRYLKWRWGSFLRKYNLSCFLSFYVLLIKHLVLRTPIYISKNFRKSSVNMNSDGPMFFIGQSCQCESCERVESSTYLPIHSILLLFYLFYWKERYFLPRIAISTYNERFAMTKIVNFVHRLFFYNFAGLLHSCLWLSKLITKHALSI